MISLQLPGEGSDPDLQAASREWLTEFLPADKVGELSLLPVQIWEHVTLLHEITG